MIAEYFDDDCEVKPHFRKRFISLWDGWLGRDRLHLLDQVNELEWGRFNNLLRSLHKTFSLYKVNLNDQTTSYIDDIEREIPSFAEYRCQEYTGFTRIVIPDLKAVYTEEWDYTWIFWYTEDRSMDFFTPHVLEAGLHHFKDDSF